jgi:hypothetical protein
VKTSWTSGKNSQEELDIKAAWAASGVLRNRLKEMCEDEIRGSYQVSKSQYDNPNWQLLQADSVGYRRALEKVISLISQR